MRTFGLSIEGLIFLYNVPGPSKYCDSIEATRYLFRKENAFKLLNKCVV